MEARSLCSVGLGLIGVWVLVQAFASLSIFIPMVFDSNAAEFFSRSAFAPPLALAAIGALLISQSHRIAEAIVGTHDPVDLSSHRLEHLLIVLLGVWLAATAVAEGAQREVALLYSFAGESSWGTAGDLLSQLGAPRAWLERIGYGSKLAFGAILIARAAQLRSRWLGEPEGRAPAA